METVNKRHPVLNHAYIHLRSQQGGGGSSTGASPPEKSYFFAIWGPFSPCESLFATLFMRGGLFWDPPLTKKFMHAPMDVYITTVNSQWTLT